MSLKHPMKHPDSSRSTRRRPASVTHSVPESTSSTVGCLRASHLCVLHLRASHAASWTPRPPPADVCEHPTQLPDSALFTCGHSASITSITGSIRDLPSTSLRSSTAGKCRVWPSPVEGLPLLSDVRRLWPPQRAEAANGPDNTQLRLWGATPSTTTPGSTALKDQSSQCL